MSKKANFKPARTNANSCNSRSVCKESSAGSKQFLRSRAAEVTESKPENWGCKQVTANHGGTAMKMHVILSCCTLGEALCI